MTTSSRIFIASAVALAVTFPHLIADADNSARVITRARAYADHPWHCTEANMEASCSPDYYSEFMIGDHMGLPYDWGGYVSLAAFDQGILDGLGAGSYPSDDVLACTVGVDCSGYVSKCWDVGHYGTAMFEQISHTISRDELKRGDALNVPNYHIVLFSHLQANGRPFIYESIGDGVHPTSNAGWSYLEDFTPIRHLSDSDDEDVVPVGTPDNPIDITLGPPGTPYRDIRDTSVADSDVLDVCGLAPDTSESGPEVIYRVELDSPGRLVVNVQDDAGIDIDVHVYSELTVQDCEARNDSTVDVQVDCGTYYIVADTWSNGSTEFVGEYELTVDFTPDNTACGTRTGYEFLGAPGSECAYPGDYSLASCNPSLGSTTCVYTGTSASDMSFCTFECQSDLDCGESFSAGCCVPIDSGADKYCLPEALCDDPVEPDAGLADVSSPDSGTLDTSVSPDTASTDAVTPDVEPSEDASPIDIGSPDATSSPDASSDVSSPDSAQADAPGEDSEAVIPSDNNGQAPTLDGDPKTGGGGEDSGCSVTSSARVSTLSWELATVALALVAVRLRH